MSYPEQNELDKKEYSFVLLKPDAVESDICVHVLYRILHIIDDGRICASKVLRVTPEILRMHYSHIVDREFYPQIEAFMTSSDVWVSIIEGRVGTIERIRKALGATDPRKAAPGTIRSEFGKITQKGEIRNVMHASDTESDAYSEIGLFFDQEKIQQLIPQIAEEVAKRRIKKSTSDTNS